MSSLGWSSILGVVLATGLATAGPGDRPRDPLDELRLEFRETNTRYRVFSHRREAQVRILQRALRLRTDAALRWVITQVRSADSIDLQRDALQLLAEEAPHRAEVIRAYREFMAPQHALRPLARTFLLVWAVRKGERPWLLRLFESGDTEDRFLAIQSLARIAAPDTLACAWQLLDDPKWVVRPSTVVHCGTLASAVRRNEGEEAARLLLLLQRDPRFRTVDAVAIRQATRTWHYIDLTRYIDMKGLAHPDGVRREMMARFMGRAGFEAARAPLLALATERRERSKVREAATEALGGLMLARGHLASKLARLLNDREEDVQRAAIRALAQLRVKDAVAALLPLLDTPLGDEARKALAKHMKLPAATDWAAWLKSKDCALPQGT